MILYINMYACLHIMHIERAPHLQFARGYLYSKYKLERKEGTEGRQGMRERETESVSALGAGQFQNVSSEIDELELSSYRKSLHLQSKMEFKKKLGMPIC